MWFWVSKKNTFIFPGIITSFSQVWLSVIKQGYEAIKSLKVEVKEKHETRIRTPKTSSKWNNK